MTQIRTHGRDNITATFQQAQDENRAALMPYFTLGFLISKRAWTLSKPSPPTATC